MIKSNKNTCMFSLGMASAVGKWYDCQLTVIDLFFLIKYSRQYENKSKWNK